MRYARPIFTTRHKRLKSFTRNNNNNHKKFPTLSICSFDKNVLLISGDFLAQFLLWGRLSFACAYTSGGTDKDKNRHPTNVERF